MLHIDQPVPSLKKLPAIVELHIDHKSRWTDSKSERQMSEKTMGSLFRGRKGRLFGGVGGGDVRGGGGSRYADIICKFCTRKVIILPFVNTKMIWISSSSIKHI